MYRLGLVDKKTVRAFDLRCLIAVDDVSARDMQALRKHEVRQPNRSCSLP